jgi:hypothetical protein
VEQRTGTSRDEFISHVNLTLKKVDDEISTLELRAKTGGAEAQKVAKPHSEK